MSNTIQSDASHEQWLANEARALRLVGETRAIIVDRMEIDTWVAQGNDKTLVFVHGNSACKEVFHKQFNHFHSLGYTVVALDLPGHGHSSNAHSPETEYTGPGYARLVIRVLNKLGVRKPIVAGWSLGGHVAIEMQGQGYEMQGLCFFGTPPVGPGPEFFDQAFLDTPFAHVTGAADVSPDELKGYSNDLYGSLKPIPRFYHDSAKRTVGLARSTMLEHWLSNVEGHNQRDMVKQSTLPYLVLQGLDDKFCSSEYLHTLKWSSLWREQLFEFSGVGHAPFLEIPEQFNQLLEGFSNDVFAL